MWSWRILRYIEVFSRLRVVYRFFMAPVSCRHGEEARPLALHLPSPKRPALGRVHPQLRTLKIPSRPHASTLPSALRIHHLSANLRQGRRLHTRQVRRALAEEEVSLAGGREENKIGEASERGHLAAEGIVPQRPRREISRRHYQPQAVSPHDGRGDHRSRGRG